MVIMYKKSFILPKLQGAFRYQNPSIILPGEVATPQIPPPVPAPIGRRRPLRRRVKSGIDYQNDNIKNKWGRMLLNKM